MQKIFVAVSLLLLTLVGFAYEPSAPMPPIVHNETLQADGNPSQAMQACISSSPSEDAAQKSRVIQDQASEIARLRTLTSNLNDKNKQLMSQFQNEVNDQQQYQQQIRKLQDENSALQAQLSSQRTSNYRLTQSLKTLQSNVRNGDVNTQKLPSTDHSLIVQTRNTVECAESGNCTIVRQLPLAENQKVPHRVVHDTLASPYFMPVTIIVLIVVVVLLVILLIVSMVRAAAKRKRNNPDDQSLEMTNENLNAVSDGDMMEAKLDMARALMEMGEQDAAKEALYEVLQHGSEGQSKMAESLLKQIES